MTWQQRVRHWFLGNLKYAQDIERLEEMDARLVVKIAEATEAAEQLREATDKLLETLREGGT